MMSEIAADVRRSDLAAMSPQALLAAAQAGGLTVRADGDRLVVRGPRSAEVDLVQALLRRKAEVLPLLRPLPPPEDVFEVLVADRPPEPARRVEPPPAVVPPPSPELEAILRETEALARRITSSERWLTAVRNLVNDCRAIWMEGKPEVALGLARVIRTNVETELPVLCRKR